MERKRQIFWSSFLGGAAVLAVIPEFMGPARSSQAPSPQSASLSRLHSALAPAPERAPAAASVPDGEPVAPQALADAVPGAPAGELFAVKNWQRPPPAPPPPPPPPPPAPPPPLPPLAAPPLPFRYMGRLDEAATVKVFLQRGDRVYAVAVGDVIDGTYRLEQIDEARLTLVYLPLQISQFLPLGRS